MKNEIKGGDLFIVDNSISGWTGLRYLQEWSGLAKSFDITTGFFEIADCVVYSRISGPRFLQGRRRADALVTAVACRREDVAKACLHGINRNYTVVSVWL